MLVVAEENDEEIVGRMDRQRELVAIASYGDVGRNEAEQGVVEKDGEPVLALRDLAIGDMEQREDEGGNQGFDHLASDPVDEFQRDDSKKNLLAGRLDRSDDERHGDEAEALPQ